MATKKESFFWTSYSDLMTSLFFIMLVLFILVIVLLHKRMETSETQLQQIRQVVNSTKDLNKDYFTYREEYKKYLLTNISVQYISGRSDIKTELDPNKCNVNETLIKLKEAGEEIKNFLDKHKETQYILIIEGQASSIGESNKNYVLSYSRALGLLKYWFEDCNLKFRENCEIQISGSGDGYIPTRSMREPERDKFGKVNEANQRFLIHILPKNVFDDKK